MGAQSMLVKIQKWGNSLALRIPKAFASQLHIESGSEVDLSLENGHLVITANKSQAQSKPHFNGLSEGDKPMSKVEFSLDELLSKVSEPSLQYAIDTSGSHVGAQVGKEPGPISNLQLEILKLYSTNLKGNELQELKTLLAGYFAKKAIHEADGIWDQHNLSNEKMDQWLNEQS
jgi:antitoxin component of MazEF toxin-antitoxin module